MQVTRGKLKHKARKSFRTLSWVPLSRYLDFNPKNNFLVFADPRGGSTWLTELIARVPGTSILFEPFHMEQVSHFNSLAFSWRPFLSEHDNSDRAVDKFDQLFRGKVLNNWLCQMTTPSKLLTAERLLIKFCRGNAILPWLTRRFEFSFLPILLLRHPFAVAASQLNHGSWDNEQDLIDILKGFGESSFHKHAEYLSGLTTKSEKLVAKWCLVNQVPLMHPENDRRWITIFYEDLLTQPDEVIDEIFNRWAIPPPILEAADIDRPSQSSMWSYIDPDTEYQLSKWKRDFSSGEIHRLLEVLDYFSLDLYGDDIFPTRRFD